MQKIFSFLFLNSGLSFFYSISTLQVSRKKKTAEVINFPVLKTKVLIQRLLVFNSPQSEETYANPLPRSYLNLWVNC